MVDRARVFGNACGRKYEQQRDRYEGEWDDSFHFFGVGFWFFRKLNLRNDTIRFHRRGCATTILSEQTMLGFTLGDVEFFHFDQVYF